MIYSLLLINLYIVVIHYRIYLNYQDTRLYKLKYNIKINININVI